MNVGERASLSALKPGEHIHGGLRIQLGDRLVPYLGYFGPDDVCFDTWLSELTSVAHAFESSTHTRHVFDEGEQGQPTFVFEREAEQAYFTIAASEFSGGEADPDWQRVEFSPTGYLDEYARFRDSLFATLRAETPDVAELWIRRHELGSDIADHLF